MLAVAWCAVGLTTAALAYRWRQRVLRLCVLIVGAGLALVLAVVLTGGVVPDLFASAARISVATVVLSIIAVLLVTRALPQLVSRHDRRSVALVFVVLTVMYLLVGAFLNAAAFDASRVQHLPQLRTRDEFIDWRDSPTDSGAVLLEANISDAAPELGSPYRDGVVAAYRCPTIDALRFLAPGQRLPTQYLLDFPGGPPIVAGRISSDQAWAWTSSDHNPGDCVLRRGDPVVVWGELRGGMGTGGPTSYTGLANVQKIAMGDIASFLGEYVPVAEHTERAVLALAVLNGVLAAAMAGIGLRAYRRLARVGTETPPRITWRSGPR